MDATGCQRKIQKTSEPTDPLQNGGAILFSRMEDEVRKAASRNSPLPAAIRDLASPISMITWIQKYFQHHFRTVFAILLAGTIISFVFVYGASNGCRSW